MPALHIAHETTTTTTMCFTEVEICEALRKAGHKIPLEGAHVTVRVPAGGDWSDTDLQIGSDVPLSIAWTTKSKSYGL